MAKFWFSESFTQLKADQPEITNASYQEKHAKKIFDKYYVVDKLGSLLDTSLYGGKDRVTQEWLTTVLRRGTSTDRVLALAFMVREKPLSSLRHIDSLLAYIAPAKKQLCIKAIEVLSNLFETTLLPSKRNLINFEDRPFGMLKKRPEALKVDLSLIDPRNHSTLPHTCRENILAMWYFESAIKQCYFRFLVALENILMSDTIPAEKIRALNALVNLIVNKPEGREKAIGIVVNKLGDRTKSFASSVIHKLRLMCQSHPHLKALLVDQIRAFLFRPNLLERAKYYAIVLLSCIPLSKAKAKATAATAAAKSDQQGSADGSNNSVAAVLFRIYLSFFRASVNADELPERLITALLTGISRVSPYISEQVMTENVMDIDSVFRLVHVTNNFNISLQALTFLFHFSTHHAQLRDRFYQALYRKLSDFGLLWSARGAGVLHLVYEAVRADPEAERRAALVQRLLGAAISHPAPTFAAGTLILVHKLRLSSSANPLGAPPGQSILPEEKPKQLLPTAIGVVKQTAVDGGDSDEEHFSDVLASSDEEESIDVNDKKQQIEGDSTKEAIPVWDHRSLLKNSKRQHKSSGVLVSSAIGYDSTVRDPRFARALGQPCWQLRLLANHAHPTVAFMAKTILGGKSVKYTGDPFEDLSSTHFFERFVYKKPKPAAAKTVSKLGDSSTEKRVHARTLAPDSLAYKNLNPEQVPSDERFIHSYFNFIKDHPRKNADAGSSDDSDLDEDFEEYLRKHEKGLIPNDLDEDEDLDDEEFNYSTDDEDPEEDAGSDDEEESAERMEVDSNGGSDLEDLDDDRLGSDGEDEDDFAPISKRSGKLDLNELFVSAEEIGDLYDNQDTFERKKGRGRGGKNKRNRGSRRGGGGSKFGGTGAPRKRGPPVVSRKRAGVKKPRVK